MSIKKLTDVASIKYGYAFNSKNFTNDSSYPQIVRIRDIKKGFSKTYYNGEFKDEYIIHRGDLLLGMDGEFNIEPWKSEKALLNQRVCKVEAKEGIDKNYLYFALNIELKKIEKKTSFATVKHLSAKVLNNIELKITNFNEQIKISHILANILKSIDLKEKMTNQLDELIKARFVEMFGEFPYNEKGWNIGTIRDLVSDVRYGTSKKASENNDGKYPYLRMNNITYDGKLDLRDLKSIDIPEKDLEKYSVKKDDILFNRTNSRELVGKTCVYTIPETMILAGFIIRVRLNELANPLFVSTFLNTDYSKQLFKTICKNASGQSNINATELQKIKIYIPPLSLQNKFANFVQQVDKSKVAVQKSLDETQKLYDSLMQEYFG